MLSILGIVKGWYKFIFEDDISEDLACTIIAGAVSTTFLLILTAIIGGIYLGVQWLLS